MSLTIAIPESMARAVEEMAARSGQTPECLILDALGAHFPPIPMALQEEFDALDRASEEDFARFEREEMGQTDGAR